MTCAAYFCSLRHVSAVNSDRSRILKARTTHADRTEPTVLAFPQPVRFHLSSAIRKLTVAHPLAWFPNLKAILPPLFDPHTQNPGLQTHPQLSQDLSIHSRPLAWSLGNSKRRQKEVIGKAIRTSRHADRSELPSRAVLNGNDVRRVLLQTPGSPRRPEHRWERGAVRASPPWLRSLQQNPIG